MLKINNVTRRLTMRNETKKVINQTRARLLCTIISVILAFAAYLICRLAVGKEKLGFPPFLMLFIVFFLSMGICYIVLSLIHKSKFTFVAGGGCFIIGAAFLMFCLYAVISWYITVITLLVMIAILFLLTFFVATPMLTIEYDNGPGSGRKPYAERKAEQEAEREEKKRNEEEKPMPEIKSFKD